MSQGTHHLDTYIDAQGQHRWRVVVEGIEGSAVEDNIVADSSQGYNNKADAMKSFFGMFFGDWDDSFLGEYNTWDPAGNQVGA